MIQWRKIISYDFHNIPKLSIGFKIESAASFIGISVGEMKVVLTRSIRDSETSIDFVQGPPGSRRERVKELCIESWHD